MKAQTASSTAETMTMHRAFEMTLPEKDQIINDPYAIHFLNERTKKTIKNLVGRFIIRFVMNNIYPGVNGAVVFRVKFIDDVVTSCIKQGVEQLVILGAGYDTRALRLDMVKTNTIVFELDHPATQKIKIEKMQSLFNNLPDHVRYLPIDFDKDDFKKILSSNGYDSGKKSLFILEGLTMYLSPQNIEEIFTFIKKQSAPGSFITFDYLPNTIVDGTIKQKEACNMIKHVMKLGEPFRFGLDRTKADQYLTDQGFEVIKNISAAEEKSIYFKDKNKKRKVSTIFSLILAKTI